MMPNIREVMLAASGSLAASIVAKVTITTALGLIAAWLARANRAAVRHALLAAAFGVMLLLPVVSLVAPPVHISLPMALENRASAFPRPLLNGVEQIPSALTAGDPGDRVISTRQASRIPWPSLLLTVWIAGVLIFLLPLIAGLWQIRLLRRSGLPWRHGQSLSDALAIEAGIGRRVEVLLHEASPGPMTCGILHPAIVLPREAESWSEEELTRAMVHELEHIRRGDSLSRCLARAACAVYWFHPLVWMAWRRLVLESERSCDDAVLARSEATAYAGQLVGLATRLSEIQRSPLLAMASRRDLAARIGAVLDARQRRGRAGVVSLTLAGAAAVVLVIAMSPLKLVAAPLPDTPAQAATTLPTHETSDPRRVIAQAAQPVQAQRSPTQPVQAPQIPATAAPSRLLPMFFDLTTLDAETLARIQEIAIRFVQTRATPADRISVMTYDSKVNVLQDFTNNQDSIVAALRMMMSAAPENNGAGNPAAGAEFDIFKTDRQLAALQNAIELLAALPERKTLLYFSNAGPKNGVDNQAQIRATLNAAMRANVAIFPIVPGSGVITVPPR